MHKFKTKVLANQKIATDHYALSFKIPKTIKRVNPGQFFNIKVNNAPDPLLRRPFSAHKIKKEKIEILYKVVGKATQILSTKKKGGEIDILGPLGNGFGMPTNSGPVSESVFLIGGGHGIAPLYALAKKLKGYKLRLTAFLGARTKEHLVCEKAFRKLGLKVYIATEDGSKGHKGLVTDLFKMDIPAAIYACGPKPMLKSIAAIANRNNVPCQLSLEEYFGCGIGVCMGCTIDTRSGRKLICKDGPVFTAEEIVWR